MPQATAESRTEVGAAFLGAQIARARPNQTKAGDITKAKREALLGSGQIPPLEQGVLLAGRTGALI